MGNPPLAVVTETEATEPEAASALARRDQPSSTEPASAGTEGPGRTRGFRRSLIFAGIAVVLLAGFLTFRTLFTLFVVQPIGAVPDGVTVVIWRASNMHFVESADAICERISGGVSLLCRAVVAGKVAERGIILRLPYSEQLYLWSTDGRTYQ